MATYIDNVGTATVHLRFSKGNAINRTYSVTVDNEDYDLTGGQLYMQVRDKYNRVHRSFTSTGDSPTITILSNTFTLYSLTPFDTVGSFDYDLLFVDSLERPMTIMRGKVYVGKAYTEIFT